MEDAWYDSDDAMRVVPAGVEPFAPAGPCCECGEHHDGYEPDPVSPCGHYHSGECPNA